MSCFLMCWSQSTSLCHLKVGWVLVQHVCSSSQQFDYHKNIYVQNKVHWETTTKIVNHLVTAQSLCTLTGEIQVNQNDRIYRLDRNEAISIYFVYLSVSRTCTCTCLFDHELKHSQSVPIQVFLSIKQERGVFCATASYACMLLFQIRLMMIICSNGLAPNSSCICILHDFFILLWCLKARPH